MGLGRWTPNFFLDFNFSMIFVFRFEAADRAQYSGRDAAAVLLQTAQVSAKAFEQAMYRKSALLQQRRQAGG